MNDAIEAKVDEIINTNKEVKETLTRRTSWLIFCSAILILVLGFFGYFLVRLNSLGTGNKANGDLLVECTTPGTNPHPKAPNDTGNACWDRLHSPDGSNNALTIIADDLYCDQRRAQAKLPPVADPSKTCREQTDPAIYPDGAGAR